MSGDNNPLHTDPIAARRLLFGEPVVHGIHLLLWALDIYLAPSKEKLQLRSLRVSFNDSLLLGEQVQYYFNGNEILLKVNDKVLAEINVDFCKQEKDTIDQELPEDNPKDKCNELTFEQASKAYGRLPLLYNRKIIAEAFPNLSLRLPAHQIAILLASSRLVGMHCPGLHSIFSGIDLNFGAPNDNGKEITYKVNRIDKRFSILFLQVQGSGLMGELKTFFRPKPQEQAGMKEVLSVVQPGEFKEQRALIIGGSRGLGEITAKVIAAGGGDVRATYYRGVKEAKTLVNEIKDLGYHAECLKFDINNPPRELDNKLGKNWEPTHFYYFATPFIFGKSPELFSYKRFKNFCDYYVNGFYKTVFAVKALTHGKLVVVFPSTIAVQRDEKGNYAPDMIEYAVAKKTGEILCRYLDQALIDTNFYIFRLPRLKTDQTASVIKYPAEDPLPHVLKMVKSITPGTQC